MISWFKKPRRAPEPRRDRSPALFVEPLESRDYLSAAMIMSFNAAPSGGTNVTLSGYIMDEQPATAQVNFSGVVTGSATPNSYGYYTFSGQATGLGTVTAVAVDAEQLSSSPAQAQVTSNAPSITNFSVQETGNGKNVSISGTVMDESPSGRSVTLGGVVSGSTTTNSSGNFSVTIEASQLGTVTAVTTDPWGLSSATAQAQLTSPAPTLSINAVEAGGMTVTVSGTMSDMTKSGRTVTIAGVAQGTATTDANGAFSVTLSASGLGQVTATVTDVWGQTSNNAAATLQSSAPVIGTFTASNQDADFWVFQGTVADEKYIGLTIIFGGLLAGSTTTVNSYGAFSFVHEFVSGTFGTATAQVTDWWGLLSAVREVLVDHTDP